jgi:hypothetical protein
VIDVSRHDDTAEITGSGEPIEAQPREEPVGRVNLPDEPEPDFEPYSGGPGDVPQGTETVLPSGQLREKVLYGLLAGVLMVLAMIVILQGVFEQKMPI